MRKKRKIILLAVVIGVSIGLVYGILQVVNNEEIGKNLLKNSNFELVDESQKPDSWTEDSNGGWSVITKDSQEGKNYMQATVGWSWLWQDIPVDSKQYYALEGYVKSDISISREGDYKNTLLTLECLNEKNEVIRREWGIVNASSVWEQKTIRIFTPSNAEKIRIKLAKRQGQGSVWFDNFELMRIPLGTILNANFELVDESQKPDSWTEDSNGGWSVITKDSQEGKNYMQATVGWSWLWQDIPVDSKQYYALEGYVKSDISISREGDYKNTLLTLECLNEKNEVIKREWGIVNADLSWQLKQSAIITPKDTEKLRIKLAKRQGQGSVWFDDFELIELPSYLKSPFLRKVLQDKPFFIFYFLIYSLLIFSLVKVILKK